MNPKNIRRETNVEKNERLLLETEIPTYAHLSMFWKKVTTIRRKKKLLFKNSTYGNVRQKNFAKYFGNLHSSL